MVFHRIRSGRAKRFPGLLLKYKQVEISANIFGGKTNKCQSSLDLSWFSGCGNDSDGGSNGRTTVFCLSRLGLNPGTDLAFFWFRLLVRSNLTSRGTLSKN